MLIRTAELADIKTLRKFEQGVIEAERPFSVNLKKGAVEYYDLQKLIEDKRSCLIVAESGGEIVASGYARIESNKTYLKPKQYAYFGFMYVSPSHRGQGLISSIMESLTHWCQQQDVNAYKLDVYVANEPAVKAYEKFGFKANMLEMWKE